MSEQISESKNMSSHAAKTSVNRRRGNLFGSTTRSAAILLFSTATSSSSSLTGVIHQVHAAASVEKVPEDLKGWPLLEGIAADYIATHSGLKESDDGTKKLPFQRGVWLYGDYKNDVPKTPTIDACKKACEDDAKCFHWQWRTTDSRCDFKMGDGYFSDADDWVCGHIESRVEERRKLMELEAADKAKEESKKPGIVKRAAQKVKEKVKDFGRKLKEKIVGKSEEQKEKEKAKEEIARKLEKIEEMAAKAKQKAKNSKSKKAHDIKITKEQLKNFDPEKAGRNLKQDMENLEKDMKNLEEDLQNLEADMNEETENAEDVSEAERKLSGAGGATGREEHAMDL